MKKLFTVLGLMLTSGSLMAQLTSGEAAETVQLNTITTAVPFLQIAPDSRASS